MNKILRITQITVPLIHNEEQILKKACRIARISKQDVKKFQIVKQSVDARHKNDLKYIYSVQLSIEKHIKYNKNEKNIQEIIPVIYQAKADGVQSLHDPIAVIGSGPAGLFCAYLLAKSGYRPIVLERGKCAEERQKDVEHFWNGGELLPESNVQFGEGGAGTFSDGKLNTLVKDKSGRNQFVLETLVQFGAPGDILYVNKPHIGTDVLRTVVTNIRNEIIRLGGTFYFSSKVTDFRLTGQSLSALEVNHSKWINVSAAVFAIGHSARDTFEVLHKKAVPMIPKAFAVGMRVEHPQEMINKSQYGESADMSLLPTAPYKLTYQARNGRSVYSFCMCPGGFVVNASSEEHRLAVNGMSYHARDSKNANSAIIVSVTPEDFPDKDNPLSGLAFQRMLEEKAWRAGKGRIPQQLLTDFENNTVSKSYGEFSSCVMGETVFSNLREVFPDSFCEAFTEGMHAFSKKIRGFDRADTILSAVESRTSSPLRILRDETFQSEIQGLYPCGEGAGYAGGITSAAMDGLKVAEAIMHVYMPMPSHQEKQADIVYSNI